MPLIKSLMLLLLIAFNCPAFAQSPYELNPKKELIHYGAGVATAGLGLYFRSTTPTFTAEELAALDISTISSFDRVATNHFSLKAHEASDYFWYGSHAAPFLLLAGKESRAEFGKIMVMYSEAAIINSGLTLLTKYAVRRPRPFNFDPNTSFEKKSQVNAKASFFSGHASITATNCFFSAKVFSDYYPDSKFKPLVWVTAATIPAITGYLRVRGGRHYPTDVISGYIVGAAVGYLVPHLHRNKMKNKNITLNMGYNSAYFGWRF